MAISAKADERSSEIRIGVLVYDHCSAWIVSGILEAFQLANVLVARLAHCKRFAFTLRTVSPLGGTVTATSGIRFDAVRPARPLDVLVVPPIWHQSRGDLVRALAHLAPIWGGLPALARRSRLVTSVCSGAVLLAEAGLLDNKTATTCWWLSEWFKTRYPGVCLTPDRLIVVDGQTWTAAAGSAYIHLCLRIIEWMTGSELSALTAKFLLVEPNRDTQAPYLSPSVEVADSEGPLACLEAFVLEHINRPIRLSELASAANMSLRTMFRYFEKAEGITPLEFVQIIRVERAKKLLELTREPIDSITPQCGYEDVSSFRKLFRKRVGMTPKEYRQRFGRFVWKEIISVGSR